jgi:hypothetical protein
MVCIKLPDWHLQLTSAGSHSIHGRDDGPSDVKNEPDRQRETSAPAANTMQTLKLRPLIS